MLVADLCRDCEYADEARVPAERRQRRSDFAPARRTRLVAGVGVAALALMVTALVAGPKLMGGHANVAINAKPGVVATSAASSSSQPTTAAPAQSSQSATTENVVKVPVVPLNRVPAKQASVTGAVVPATDGSYRLVDCHNGTVTSMATGKAAFAAGSYADRTGSPGRCDVSGDVFAIISGQDVVVRNATSGAVIARRTFAYPTQVAVDGDRVLVQDNSRVLGLTTTLSDIWIENGRMFAPSADGASISKTQHLVTVNTQRQPSDSNRAKVVRIGNGSVVAEWPGVVWFTDRALVNVVPGGDKVTSLVYTSEGELVTTSSDKPNADNALAIWGSTDVGGAGTAEYFFKSNTADDGGVVYTQAGQRIASVPGITLTSCNGTFIALSADQTAYEAWSTDGKLLWSSTTMGTPVGCRSNGTLLALADDGLSTQVVDARTGAVVGEFTHAKAATVTVQGAYVVVTTVDGTVSFR